MERQLSLLPDIDDKKVQKEVVSILKEYRALKMRFSNEVEQEGISLFPELRDSRNTSKWKVQQVEKALNNLLDEDERNCRAEVPDKRESEGFRCLSRSITQEDILL